MSRNIWCPKYDECLDEAVRARKSGFSCEKCAQAHNEENKPTYHEAAFQQREVPYGINWKAAQRAEQVRLEYPRYAQGQILRMQDWRKRNPAPPNKTFNEITGSKIKNCWQKGVLNAKKHI